MSSPVETGMRGQKIAEDFLQGKGIRILERNYRLRTGEIDLIARDGAYIVFIEVKYRNSLRYGYPRESVNSTKQQHIRQTARHYILKHQLTQQDFRFDVVEVLNDRGQLRIEHIENAFA